MGSHLHLVGGDGTWSFQFIEFPSEWGALFIAPIYPGPPGFQFIEFPSEWGGDVVILIHLQGHCFQFIEFPSEWGVPPGPRCTRHSWSFQFIEFPSEWGAIQQRLDELYRGVSNLLSSPASGELAPVCGETRP